MKQNETNLGEKGEKGEIKYHCIMCDYLSCIKFSYERHLTTSKHQKQLQILTNETNETNNETKLEKKEKKEKLINNICSCGQVYYSRTTLWRHKQKCNYIEKSSESEINNNDTSNKDELINYLIKENKDFKNLILEIVKKDTIINNNSNNSNNTTNNSHNKTFNLQFFLNETCKDAMNIMEFVDSIKIQLSDL